MNQDTICAIATAQGGAIGSIRVSGPEAITITSRIFTPAKSGKLLSEQKPYTLTFGRIYNGEEMIDEVLVSLFRAPHSYTGEDSTEITCHGSSYILQQVMQLLIKNGCRMAQPGEYTQRAFLNGKMDLSQAEAVADLIASSSAATHRLALSQMRGGFSKELTTLREKLLNFTSMIELELDFSEEDVEFADRSALRRLADEIEEVIARLANSFSVGNVIKNGVPVAIIGETNAGKSTLLNVLLNEDKAIVSDIHGTTRDVIEDTVNIGGITFRFIDTAGIRETSDTIESLGIERTFQKLDQAEIVLWMIDSADAISQLTLLSDKILPRCEHKQLILVFNKVELINETQKNELASQFSEHIGSEIESIFISAKQRLHTDELQQRLVAAAHLPTVTQNNVIVTNVRHYEALTRALDAIHRVQEGLDANISGDFLSQDIRECIFHLSDIAGEVTNDMVLQNIFAHFCIGK
ncbi:tRNA uridine-5-carboxymethylaminomethyl(34) synthesis GTPase MnmE [Bacteroides fragilis]|jgi:tRNA modification GTPase|uniref:tRNA uridine-5-carboxymethylaminomethyl(34) synthesis GTPase MnmE n=1 Tax=Bacteroides fragilis TaxID=817 RepID=UPI000EC5926E|nr:tRNA uridine-5-carboxymethylaminomethyl(34) synthesis GTPase MnmE [Bacteroides fragilis]MCB5657614.1 tRNA uridine-5-carboxymethylaminomethyl(34) synthesis GTPase MnmE [Bacteroides fragilis]MCB5700322.1 tRNA uridine-5-carboxymethylaminomethyl(34) synthesis GTPase MnmE [Bacteroides fragilis]RGL78432.1 tRNA uridine-5-carboxymethylaminomethyl(34) synthesis GTPase MnmE [Bacteroides fragilis]RHI14364.1 tRNA uridine-5-carboxymethylaminomethyl(34) synthesis GTPase MnmE [Bacteroides fragilis]RHI2681